MMKEEMMWLWFNNIEEIGLISRWKLLRKFKSIEDIYNGEEKQFNEILTESQIKKLINSKKSSKYEEIYHRLLERKIHYVYPGHRDYPVKLLNIHEPPTLLYIKGKINNSINSNNMNIAIVGSRKHSVYGKEMAYKFSRDLAVEGINVISGLALGIDGVAHQGALEGNGYTVGVLGCGINVTYPRENTELYAEIEKNGAIISEYGLDVEPCSGYFPMRNRIISGLSDGILVVEAKKKSGSLITVDYGLEQGKQIYAIPGKLHDANSEGTNSLIKNGAFLVMSYKDIMFDLTGKEEYKDMEDKNHKTVVNKNFLAPLEKIVYSCLSLEPTYIDDIIPKLGVGVTKTISILYSMEEKGIIKQPVRGYYIISV